MQMAQKSFHLLTEGGRPRLRLETGSMSEALGQGDRWRANPPRQRHSRAHPVVVDVSVFCVRARAARAVLGGSSLLMS